MAGASREKRFSLLVHEWEALIVICCGECAERVARRRGSFLCEPRLPEEPAEEPADAEAAAEAPVEEVAPEEPRTLARQSSNVGEKGAALNSTVQLNPEDGDVQEQLRQILIDNAVRVIDLFRDWDDDGNGKVDKKEFRKAMKALGLDVPRKEVDGLFDTFDPDGGGSIEYNELNKALKRKVALDPSMQAGAVPIEVKVSQGQSPDS